MERFSAVDLNTKMGQVIDRAMAHPVVITRYRRDCVVMLNVEEFERLTAAAATLADLQKRQEDKGS